jgi:mRNA interferase RelE/StbE
VPYTLLYHPEVTEEDLPPVPRNVQHRISRAIAARLAMAPERHGLPLRGTLKGYWKLRVGDYRVVYKIVGTEVWILAILHRKHVYKDVLPRTAWHPG